MIFKKTKISGLYRIEHNLIVDERGSFARTFDLNEFHDQNLKFSIVQIDRSVTKQKGTIRGMHFQKAPKAEDKIVQCIKGSIYDVAIDLRKESHTFGQWVAEELSEEKQKMVYIPQGFAHGFQALTDDCEVQYLMSEYYSPEHGDGVRWNDPAFKIKWPLSNPYMSDKDKTWPLL